MYSYAEYTGKWFYRTLSIQGNDFIAPRAYEEMILSHPEHTRKCLKVEYLGRIEYDFRKYRVKGPWDQKSIKKCHACVPLRSQVYCVHVFK
jgi:hypothetical protein